MTPVLIALSMRGQLPASTEIAPGTTPISWQNRTYTDAIRRAGGIPLLIAVGASAEEVRRIYDLASGVLICGGPDVDPNHYGADVLPNHGVTVDSGLDSVDLQLAQWALADDRPLLGVCRGAQVMAVVSGGELWQDIERQIGTSVAHRNDGPPAATHDVQVQEPSRLAVIMGPGRHLVNSRHHQSISKLGAGTRATAVCEDGVIEAIEFDRCRFAVGVQWHPEELLADRASVALFAAFVSAAAAPSTTTAAVR